jgi:hypothetical protein
MLQLIEAQEKHSPILQKFFASQIVSGHVDYSIQRSHGFFEHYKLFSDDSMTLLLMDSEQNLLGTASVLFSRAYVNHQEQTVAYLCDLRISQKRKVIQEWSSFFIPALYKKLEEKNCKYVFSLIEQFENQAYNALLRPQKLKRSLPHYYLYRKLNMIFFIGKWPWAPEPMPSIRLSHGEEKDLEEICTYLMQKKIGSKFYFNLTPDALKQKMKIWPNFSPYNFILARNSKGQLVGCMAPWNNRDAQQWVAQKYSGEGELIYNILKLTKPFRLTTAFPPPGRPVNTKFLTHLGVDNAEVFYALLHRAYAESEHDEILVHTNYFGDYHTRPPEGFMSTKIPFGFYSVLSPEADLPAFLKPNPFSPPPDFNFVHL